MQGTISESTGTFLHCINLSTILCFPAATVLTLTSMTPGITQKIFCIYVNVLTYCIGAVTLAMFSVPRSCYQKYQMFEKIKMWNHYCVVTGVCSCVVFTVVLQWGASWHWVSTPFSFWSCTLTGTSTNGAERRDTPKLERCLAHTPVRQAEMFFQQ